LFLNVKVVDFVDTFSKHFQKLSFA